VTATIRPYRRGQTATITVFSIFREVGMGWRYFAMRSSAATRRTGAVAPQPRRMRAGDLLLRMAGFQEAPEDLLDSDRRIEAEVADAAQFLLRQRRAEVGEEVFREVGRELPLRRLLVAPPLLRPDLPALELLVAQPGSLDVAGEDDFLARGPEDARDARGAGGVDVHVGAIGQPGNVGAALQPDAVEPVRLAPGGEAELLLVHTRLLAAG
jgi:hypothetical protein